MCSVYKLPVLGPVSAIYLESSKISFEFQCFKSINMNYQWNENSKNSQNSFNMCTILLPIAWLYIFPNIKILSKPRSWYSNLTILVKNEWRFLPLRAIDSESAAESFPIHRNIDPDTSTMQMIPALVKTPFHRNNSSPINMPSEIGHIPL